MKSACILSNLGSPLEDLTTAECWKHKVHGKNVIRESLNLIDNQNIVESF